MGMILEVHGLRVMLKRGKGRIAAVDDLSFSMKPGETLGIIGESGSGKSLTCMGMLGLLDKKIWEVQGNVVLDGEAMDPRDKKGMSRLWGNRTALIMQNPMSAFNPVITVGAHFYETLNKAGMDKKGRAQVTHIAADLLEKMHIRDPEAVLRSYAFQLSGGMIQMIMIALALAVQPDVLVADEPTTALDLSVQNEILKILRELQDQYKMAILMVSHDLSVIRELSDDIAVMYAGNFVERGSAQTVLEEPRHPYTKGLFSSRPAFSKDRLAMMEGQPPSLEERGGGCRFYLRCKERCEACLEYQADPAFVEGQHLINCVKYR